MPEHDEKTKQAKGTMVQEGQAGAAPQSGIMPLAAGEEAPTFARSVSKIMPTFGTARQDPNLSQHVDITGATTTINIPASGVLTPTVGPGWVHVNVTTDDSTGGTLTSVIVRRQEGTLSGTTFTATKTEIVGQQAYSPAIPVTQTPAQSADVIIPVLGQLNAQRLVITITATGILGADVEVGATSGDS